MSFAAVAITTVGTAYAGHQAGKAQKESARLQQESAREGQALTQEAQEQMRQDLDPFRQFGVGALQSLSGKLGIQPAVQQAQTRDNIAYGEADYDDYLTSGEWVPSELQGAFKMMGGYSDPEMSARLMDDWRRELPDLMTDVRTKEDFVSESVGKPQLTTKPGMQFAPQPVSHQIPTQQAGNPLLDQAMSERAAFDPMNTPLMARAQTDRMGFDPLDNDLLASASEKQMAMDPSQAMSPEILQNPLLRAMQDDVSRRLMANQAARGKLGSGGTAEELQNRLVPQAIQFGLQMNELSRQDISDRARLGGAQVGLQEAAMAGRENLGFGINESQRLATGDRMQAGLAQEDLDQRQIANLMDAARMGQSSAAQVGLAGQNAASQMGQFGMAYGQAGAAGALGRAQAKNQMVGGLAGAGLYALGNYQPTSTLNTNPSGASYQPTTQQWGNLGLDQQIIPKY